ncbi:MAG TPA: hypothetical protein VHX87_04600 [Galbitalea sp.]|jgi:hypothetical protein|nr:hypothetical protein [Galbitalea sp.]
MANPDVPTAFACFADNTRTVTFGVAPTSNGALVTAFFDAIEPAVTAGAKVIPVDPSFCHPPSVVTAGFPFAALTENGAAVADTGSGREKLPTFSGFEIAGFTEIDDLGVAAAGNALTRLPGTGFSFAIARAPLADAASGAPLITVTAVPIATANANARNAFCEFRTTCMWLFLGSRYLEYVVVLVDGQKAAEILQLRGINDARENRGIVDFSD